MLYLFIFVVCFIKYIHNKTKTRYYADNSYQDIGSVDFIYDIDNNQSIFNDILEKCRVAQDYIIIDMFLFNSSLDNTHYNYIEELYSVLKLASNRNVDIYIILDPINTMYGNFECDVIRKLRKYAKICYYNIDYSKWSNPLYSSLYYSFFNFGTSISKRFSIPNFESKVGCRNIFKALNLNANHRKVFLIDDTAYISTANLHNLSSKHVNVCAKVKGNIVKSIFYNERLLFKQHNIDISNTFNYIGYNETICNYTNEASTKKLILRTIDKCCLGSNIKLMMFYLSDRDIIESLKNAHNRGVKIQVIFDKNTNSFGYKKCGIPNKPVAMELYNHGLTDIRWYDTEYQMHVKMMIVDNYVLLGSANYTDRNLGYTLESNISYHSSSKNEIYFFNSCYDKSIPYNDLNDKSLFKYFLYRIMCFMKLTTF